MSRTCPRPERLARFASGEPDPAVATHVGACAACAAAIASDHELIELVRQVPAPRLDPRGRDRLAALVLAAPEPAAARRPGRYRAAMVAVGLAAAAGLAVAGAAAWRPAPRPLAAQVPTHGGPAPTVVTPLPLPLPPAPTPPPAPTHVGRPTPVHASPGARYAVHQRGDRLEVELEQGALTLDGRDHGATAVVIGARRIAASADARYRVEAEGGSLHAVQVFAGSVEIVGRGRAATVTAGETWTLPAPTPPAAPAPLAPDPRGSVASSAPEAPVSPLSPAPPDAAARAASTAFRDAWADLDAGRFRAAAEGFARAATEPALAEDAAYWGAIAHARAGDDLRARAALTAWLARYPRSPHVGAAHLTLGRLLADDPAAARPHLEAAAVDPDPRVSAAAKAALGASP